MSNLTHKLFYYNSNIEIIERGETRISSATILGIFRQKLIISYSGKPYDLTFKVDTDNKPKKLKNEVIEFHTEHSITNIKLNLEKSISRKGLVVLNIYDKDLHLYRITLYNSFKNRILHNLYCISYIRKFIEFSFLFLKLFVRIVKQYKLIFKPKELYGEIIKAKRILGNRRRVSNFLSPADQEQYQKYISKETFEDYGKFTYNPLISIVMPVYNAPIKYLRACIDSVLAQKYTNFELCIADDCSTDENVIAVLKEYENNYDNIKVVYREKNGHISAATNSAIGVASGDFIGFIDNDDVLSPYALQEVVNVLNDNQSVDLVYSDEDKLDSNGRRIYPNFKPDFSPEYLFVCNYICHFTVIRKTLVDKVGGLEVGLDGVQDHDLMLKITELTNNIVHIPKILYHWRMIEGSTAADNSNKDYIAAAGKKMIENALKRRNLQGKVKTDLAPLSSMYITEFGNDNELISIIIPTKNGYDLVKSCVDSIFQRSTYKNFEIILVDNGSDEEESLKLFEDYDKAHDNFRILRIDCEFNYSYLNNEAVKVADGDYILLLNNDTEVITPNWLERMLGYARLDHVGCVGAKLLYDNELVQHNGVVAGLGGIACHVFLMYERNEIGYNGYTHIPTNFSVVTAACLMVKKSLYLDVNGLNENELKVAYNDVDFCLRVKEKGYFNVLNPLVELFHYESISRGSDREDEQKKQRSILEMNYMFNRHKEALFFDPFYNVNFSLACGYHMELGDRMEAWFHRLLNEEIIDDEEFEKLCDEFL